MQKVLEEGVLSWVRRNSGILHFSFLSAQCHFQDSAQYSNSISIEEAKLVVTSYIASCFSGAEMR